MTYEEYYELGQQAQREGYISMCEVAMKTDYLTKNYLSLTENVFFQAGLLNRQMPYKVTGWRLGDIPECGQSYNYKDNEPEAGVSTMATNDGDETINKVSATFIKLDERKKIYITGYKNTIKHGSDGEPLILDALVATELDW